MTGTTKNALANGDYNVAFSLKNGVESEGLLSFTDSHIFTGDETEYLVDTFNLTMKEIASQLPGYGFDTKVYGLTVNVYNGKGRENLKVVIKDDNGNVLSDDNGGFLTDKTPVFNNTYRANGNIQLSAEKTVVGHSLEANQFAFDLYENNTLLQENVKNGAGALTGTNTYTGNVNFDVIKYTQADVGTKTYRIVEKSTNLPGYTYDPTEYTVVVKIEDNDNGTLTSSIQSIVKSVGGTNTTESKIEFINTYKTSDTDVELVATKTLTGREMVDGQFSFKLTQVDATGSFIKEIGQVTNKDGLVNFPKLTFKQSDVGNSYYYQISEVDGGLSYYTYDSSVYFVKIDIVDNNDGTLSAKQSVTKAGQSVSNIAFSNSYYATGSTTVTAQKILTGKALPVGQFSFSMQQFDQSTGNTIGAEKVAINTVSGEITFPVLTFTQDDAGKTFYYHVKEVNDGVGGYTYDSTVYTLSVAVTDNGDGTLNAVQKIVEPDDKTDITFANTYTASDTFARLTANKILTGRVLQDQQFTFALNRVTENGAVIEELQKQKNNVDGTVTFDDLIFTQADMGKTYYYTIREVQEDNPGYGYDSTFYTIKIEVVDNNDGTSTANKTILKGDELVLSALFTNSYTVTDTKVQIVAEKTLKGRSLAEGQFKFSLTLKGDETQKDVLSEEVTNSADGSIRFTPITYTQADMGKTFIYEIKEINDGKSGYEYDNTVYTVMVQVIDNGDGTLSTKTTSTKQGSANQVADAQSINFSNVYTAKGSVKFSATKEMIGKKLIDRQFTFALADKEGKILQTVYKDADGNILFNEIAFNQDQIGEHQYQIYEIAGNQEGVIFDKTIYFLTVIVTDNGDGTLKTEIIVKKDNTVTKTDSSEILFVNQYKKPSAFVDADVPKTGTGSMILSYALLVSSAAFIALMKKKKKAISQ